MLASNYKNKWQSLAGIKITENSEPEQSKPLLKEGRYDDVVGKIVDHIWSFIRESRKKYDENPSHNKLQSTESYLESSDLSQHDGGNYGGTAIDTNVKHGYYRYVKTPPDKSKLKFTFVLHVYRDKALDTPFNISSETGVDDVEILIQLNPLVETKGYNELNAKLQNLVRHEVEHLTQYPGSEDEESLSYKKGKELPTSEKLKSQVRAIMAKDFANMSDVELQENRKKVVEFLTLPDEIPAFVHGLYREAKTKKESLDTIFREYLNEYSDLLTDQDISNIETKWLIFAAKNLPAAKYTERAKNKIAIFRDLVVKE